LKLKAWLVGFPIGNSIGRSKSRERDESDDANVRRTAFGVIVAVSLDGCQRFVCMSRYSTVIDVIVESSIFRTSGSCAFGWYSIVNPDSGVFGSASMYSRM